MKTIGFALRRNLDCRPVPAALSALILLSATGGQAAWLQEDGVLAWKEDARTVWRLNYSAKDGKPFFHPLTAGGGATLTAARPGDHPWHYGLWFSWKYINTVNYWEQDRKTGLAEGRTVWSKPEIQSNADGSASVKFDLEYVHPSGRVELKEHRRLAISTPAADGSYSIDWNASFVAGPEGAKLDRTPMLGEPKGQVNGGYAGLSLRMAAAPVSVSLITEHAPVAEFTSSRARPDSGALASNYSLDGEPVGAIAILSDPANVKGSSPWYVLFSEEMRFYCSAILAPKPLELTAGEPLTLRYRVLVRPIPWTSPDLQSALDEWKPAD